MRINVNVRVCILCIQVVSVVLIIIPAPMPATLMFTFIFNIHILTLSIFKGFQYKIYDIHFSFSALSSSQTHLQYLIQFYVHLIINSKMSSRTGRKQYKMMTKTMIILMPKICGLFFQIVQK